jgi:DNA polymerase-3 subunit gamma/tau
LAITEGSSLDVLELDAASHNSVEDIRDMRLSVATVASGPNARRIYILDEAHMLSKAAGNALLKTLEEPPEHVIFVLATTEPYKLLDTIRSRTQRFDFHPVAMEAVAAHLGRISDAEGYKTDPRALVELARHASGSVRDALSLLEQVAALGSGTVDPPGVRRSLGTADTEVYGRLAEAIADGDAPKGLELVAELSARGVDLRRFVGEAIGFMRGVFLAHYAPNLSEIADEPAEILEAWKKSARKLGSAEVLRSVDLLGEALVKLREGREERLMVELAVIRLTRPETSSDAGAVSVRLERLERERAASPRVPIPQVSEPVETSKPSESLKFSELIDPAEPTLPPPPSPGGSAPSGATAFTLDRLNEVWPAIFGALRQVLGARRWALFREAVPGGVEGNRIILVVGQDFHLEGLQRDQAVNALVATQASDLLGTEVQVEFRKSGRPSVVEEVVDLDLDKEALAEAPADVMDPTSLLQRELGATLVDEVSGELD